jgi:hypothetical protein
MIKCAALPCGIHCASPFTEYVSTLHDTVHSIHGTSLQSYVETKNQHANARLPNWRVYEHASENIAPALRVLGTRCARQAQKMCTKDEWWAVLSNAARCHSNGSCCSLLQRCKLNMHTHMDVLLPCMHLLYVYTYVHKYVCRYTCMYVHTSKSVRR